MQTNKFRVISVCFSYWSLEMDRPCLSTIHPHAVFSRASRELTASVRRWHGELGVLIKILYNSACAVHERDNRPEGGGGWWILETAALIRTSKLTWRSARSPKFCCQVWLKKFPKYQRKVVVCLNSILKSHVVILKHERVKRKQSDIVMKDNTVHEGVAPLVWRFGWFPILISNPAPCNGRWHLLY